MEIRELIGECGRRGVTVCHRNGAIRLRGTPEAVREAAMLLRPHKEALLRHLADELWGDYSPYCCGIAPEAVDELHRLIAEYGRQFGLAERETARIIEAAKKQPLASVPASAAAFRHMLRQKDSG